MTEYYQWNFNFLNFHSSLLAVSFCLLVRAMLSINVNLTYNLALPGSPFCNNYHFQWEKDDNLNMHQWMVNEQAIV